MGQVAVIASAIRSTSPAPATPAGDPYEHHRSGHRWVYSLDVA